MVFSGLQRYILLQAVTSPGRALSRGSLAQYYATAKRRPKPRALANVIARSLDRLIGRGLLVGHGRKTSRKWFIQTVKLTPRGRGMARRFLGQQQSLPLKLKKEKRRASRS